MTRIRRFFSLAEPSETRFWERCSDTMCFLLGTGSPRGGGMPGGTYAAAKEVCVRDIPQLQAPWKGA